MAVKGNFAEAAVRYGGRLGHAGIPCGLLCEHTEELLIAVCSKGSLHHQ